MAVLNLNATKKQEVSFTSGAITLRGTLYLPDGEGPFPAVVFVHGSGCETRDNSNYSAKWLAKIGYASLTFDKRGCGESDGEESDWKRFNFKHLAEDVVAAVSFLSSQKKIDIRKVGIHATSQGGWVAPLAASKTDLINFMIIKSASVSTVEEDRIFERAERLKSEGFSDKEINEAKQMQLAEPISQEDSFRALYHEFKDRAWYPRVYGSLTPESEFLIEYRKWYSTIYQFDPIPLLKKKSIPTLWIFGDPMLDKLGPVTQSIESVERLKEEEKAYTIKSYPGQGHNIKEKAYEKDLYNWLIEVNGDSGYKFKKH